MKIADRLRDHIDDKPRDTIARPRLRPWERDAMMAEAADAFDAAERYLKQAREEIQNAPSGVWAGSGIASTPIDAWALRAVMNIDSALANLQGEA